MIGRRATRPGLGIAAAALGALACVAIASAVGVPSDPSTQAGELAAAAPIEFGETATRWNGPALVARAELLGQAVPLPAGGNFNGIRWKDMQDAGDQDIQFLLQVNAACQWLRAAADQRDAAASSQILREIPQWPALRDGELGDAFRSAFAQAASPGTADSAQLQQCREAQQRQVAYATVHGAPPPA